MGRPCPGLHHEDMGKQSWLSSPMPTKCLACGYLPAHSYWAYVDHFVAFDHRGAMYEEYAVTDAEWAKPNKERARQAIARQIGEKVLAAVRGHICDQCIAVETCL